MITNYDAQIVFRSLNKNNANQIASQLNDDDECQEVEVLEHPEEPDVWYVYAAIYEMPAESNLDIVQFCRVRWSNVTCDKMWTMVVESD